MAGTYYSLLARLQLAALPVRRALRGMPLPRRAMHRVGSRIRRFLVPSGSRTWVEVERGFAQGLWLRLDLFSEGNYWLGQHELAVQEFLKSFASPGCVAYDVGAYVGFFALAVARHAGSKARVFAFEPDLDNSVRIRENACRNHLEERVQVVNAAAWSYSSAGGVAFRRGHRQRTYGGVAADGHVPVLADGEAVLVPSIGLDNFVREGHPPPDIVKIDVEGGECEVLKGAEHIFSHFKPSLVCEVHHEEAARWIENWLSAKGYETHWLVPREFFPRILFAAPLSGIGFSDADKLPR